MLDLSVEIFTWSHFDATPIHLCPGPCQALAAVEFDNSPSYLSLESRRAIKCLGCLFCLMSSVSMWLLYKPVSVDTDLAPGSDLSRLLSPHIRSEKFHHIGRLDQDTSGLLLFSKDGQVTHSILSSTKLEKTYLARVAVEPTQDALSRLIDGVELSDGAAHAVSAKRVQEDDACVGPLFMTPNFQSVSEPMFFVRVVTREGRNRIVRRMLAAVGLPVLALHRERVGDLLLPACCPGSVFPVTDPQSVLSFT